jgi:hypothetical protein
MPTVPFTADETTDEKRETTGELTILTTEGFAVPLNVKPEAIVRPLRRRDPSDAQIIDKLTKLEKPQKAQKDALKEVEKKPPQFRWSQSRDSKRSSRDVSDLAYETRAAVLEFSSSEGKWKNRWRCVSLSIAGNLRARLLIELT